MTASLLQQLIVDHYLFDECLGYFQKLKKIVFKKTWMTIVKGKTVFSDILEIGSISKTFHRVWMIYKKINYLLWNKTIDF